MSIHEAAPDLLLEKIAEMQSIITKTKLKSPANEALQFYEDLLRVMQFAFAFMKDTQYIHEQNTILRDNQVHLARLNKQLTDQINEYMIVSRLKAENRLDQVVKQIESFADFHIKHKNLRNDENA